MLEVVDFARGESEAPISIVHPWCLEGIVVLPIPTAAEAVHVADVGLHCGLGSGWLGG